MEQAIDIVITWVDNNDPKWIADYNAYFNGDAGHEATGKHRFEDLESLLYIFRGIEEFMPWVRKIHLVTSGHKPKWLVMAHPKLQIVIHDKIFPNRKYLPTFNPCAIEMCLLNIPGLAEKFIYFNDDMFVLHSLEDSRFFHDGTPKDFLAFDLLPHDGVFSHILHSTMQVINKEYRNTDYHIIKSIFHRFNYRYGLRRILRNLILSPFSFISLLEIYHHPQPLTKKGMIEIIDRYPIEVEMTRKNRFRSATDLNQYLFRYFNLIKGNFYPHNPKDALFVRVASIGKFEAEIKRLRGDKEIAFVCFNESADFDPIDYCRYKELLKEYLGLILPNKSSFEK